LELELRNWNSNSRTGFLQPDFWNRNWFSGPGTVELELWTWNCVTGTDIELGNWNSGTGTDFFVPETVELELLTGNCGTGTMDLELWN
jgi:hypothetical protein